MVRTVREPIGIVEHGRGFKEINAVLCEICLSFAFVPYERVVALANLGYFVSCHCLAHRAYIRSLDPGDAYGGALPPASYIRLYI